MAWEVHGGWEVNGGIRPLPQSLGLVARLGLRNGLALGYAIDQLLHAGEAWEQKIAGGAAIPKSDGNGLTVLSFPLGTEDTETGALSFVLRATASNDARRVLEQIASACQAIWRVWHIHASYAREVLRIADLEAELADSKIADRAQALLAMGDMQPSPAAVISRSVATVLGPYQLGNVLKKVAGDLEREKAEYAAVRKAKGFLQESKNLTEAQAYLHLRQVSRQTRRPLPEIASELMEFGFVAPRNSPRPLRRP